MTAPQLPHTSLAADVERVHHVLSLQNGPTIIAGHSFGGQIITALGTDAPHVILGLAWLPEDDYVNHFAADVDPIQAKIMYATQQPLAASTLQDVMGVPAWKSLPSWYMVAASDEAIPPAVERMFAKRMGATTVEVVSSHVAMVSHPGEVTMLIEDAVATIS